jgi:coproporphyrinogen III oxidase-like Fe-S oxidoreductase
MLNALRLRAGFLESEFVSATGLGFAEVESTLAGLVARGLLTHTGSRWMPTSAGFDFLNDLIAAFLPSPDASVRRVVGA